MIKVSKHLSVTDTTALPANGTIVAEHKTLGSILYTDMRKASAPVYDNICAISIGNTDMGVHTRQGGAYDDTPLEVKKRACVINGIEYAGYVIVAVSRTSWYYSYTSNPISIDTYCIKRSNGGSLTSNAERVIKGVVYDVLSCLKFDWVSHAHPIHTVEPAVNRSMRGLHAQIEMAIKGMINEHYRYSALSETQLTYLIKQHKDKFIKMFSDEYDKAVGSIPDLYKKDNNIDTRRTTENSIREYMKSHYEKMAK